MPDDPCLVYPWTVVYPWTIVYPGGLCPPVVDYGPGGGGFGGVMGDAHFDRYEARRRRGERELEYASRYEPKTLSGGYKPRATGAGYKPRYEPTIRKQTKA